MAHACDGKTLVPESLTGFEHGRKGYSNDNFVAANGGAGVAIASAAARSGAYGLRIAAGGAPSGANEWRLWQTMPRSGAARVAVRLDSLPAADVAQLFALDTAYHAPRSSARVGYDAATQQLELTVTAKNGARQTVAGPPAVAGGWHVIDLRYDVSGATHAADWRVDGVDHGSASVAAGAAEALYRIELGTNTGDAYTASIDDVMLSANAADYPMGDGRVQVLKPNAMGQSAGTAVRDNDGTALDASSWTRLDEIPAIATTDFIQQTAASSTSYGEVAFEDTAATCIRAVRGYFTTHSASTSGSNNAKLSVFDGARESIVKSGDFNANNLYSRDYSRSLTPASSWTQGAVNGLVARFGYSTDVKPVPILDGVLVEYEVVPGA